MKDLNNFILESLITDKQLYNSECDNFLKFAKDTNNDAIDIMKTPELKKLRLFFPDNSYHRFYNSPEIEIAISRLKGYHDMHIIKYKNDKKSYWGLLCGKDNNFICNNPKKNIYFSFNAYSPGKPIKQSERFSPIIFTVFYFDTVDKMLKQIVNKAVEVYNSDNEIKRELAKYVKEENLPEKYKPSNIAKQKWEALLKKYNVNNNEDVIVSIYDREKFLKDENWGKFSMDILTKFADEERHHRYSDIIYHFKNKNLEHLYNEWNNSRSEYENLKSYYGNGTID